MTLQGPLRKVVHATLFELLAVVLVGLGLSWLLGQDATETGALALVTSLIAMVWNIAFNTAFEAWERRQADRRRTVRRRVAHAIGFEGGMVAMTVPLIAWWLEMGWWEALLTDLGLMAFFLVYAFVFNWAFDQVFGLPASASPPTGGEPGEQAR